MACEKEPSAPTGGGLQIWLEASWQPLGKEKTDTFS